MSSAQQAVHGGASPVFEETLKRKKLLARSQDVGKWICLNLLLAAILLYDANHGTFLRFPSPVLGLLIYLMELVCFSLLISSVVSHVWHHLFPLAGRQSLLLSKEQLQLMRLHPSSLSFKQAGSTPAPVDQTPFKVLPGSLVSSVSPSPSSPSGSSTPVNQSANSWLDLSSVSAAPSTSWNKVEGSPESPPMTNYRRDHYNGCSSPLTDEKELSDYLTDFQAWESFNSQSNLEDSGSVASQSVLSFWKPTPGLSPARIPDWSPQLKKSDYQLSSPLPGQTNTKTQSADSADTAQSEILSQRLGVDTMRLVSWNKNVRVWITQTILRPLVSEIDQVNGKLLRLGISDCKIGEVALDRLKHVSLLPQVSMQLPSLVSLIPFLECSNNQDYLVQRLRDLAATGAISKYKWSGGASHKGEMWSDKLPTDSELVMQCLAAYMDSRLPSASSVTRGSSGQLQDHRAFSGQFFYRMGEKPDVKNDKDILAIVQTSAKPPHYVVQIGSSRLDVGAGRNNLIHTMLLFLHEVKHKRSGMLGRVNLGLSGLNILWVLD